MEEKIKTTAARKKEKGRKKKGTAKTFIEKTGSVWNVHPLPLKRTRKGPQQVRVAAKKKESKEQLGGGDCIVIPMRGRKRERRNLCETGGRGCKKLPGHRTKVRKAKVHQRKKSRLERPPKGGNRAPVAPRTRAVVTRNKGDRRGTCRGYTKKTTTDSSYRER